MANPRKIITFMACLPVYYDSELPLVFYKGGVMRFTFVATVVLAVAFCVGTALAIGAPDLTGKWQVITSEWHSEKLGFNVDKPREFTFNITGQKRKIFWGKRTFWDQSTRTVRSVSFSGVVGVNNDSVFIKESGNGIAHGTLVDGTKMYLYFMSNNNDAKITLWEIVRME